MRRVKFREDQSLPEKYQRAGKQRYPHGHTKDDVRAVVWVLEDWFWAMEEGTAEDRQPDPYYIDPAGKVWIDSLVEDLIKRVDDYFTLQVKSWANPAAYNVNKVGADAGPDFGRLGMNQKYALMQDLQRAIAGLIEVSN